MKNYRVTVMTPTLVGDGQRLSPIDYMVWKDQVNVLDQKRIFRLLAKGPRLENYLTQIRRAEKLDFATWGGFAQNFAGRRIPFAHPDYTGIWERTPADQLFISTFAASQTGMYLPASPLKGAIRTAMLLAKLTPAHLGDVESRLKGDRPPRYPTESVENALLGHSGVSRTRPLLVSDSQSVPWTQTKVFLLKTSTLRQAGAKLELGWKQPVTFAEMAVPGTVFEGEWQERFQFHKPELLRALQWKETSARKRSLDAANQAAETLLVVQAKYAEQAGMTQLGKSVAALREELARVAATGRGCLLPIGWGTGFAAKTPVSDETREAHRQLLRYSIYSRAIQTGLPFPKTRKIIFHGNVPWTLPGWVRLELN